MESWKDSGRSEFTDNSETSLKPYEFLRATWISRNRNITHLRNYKLYLNVALTRFKSKKYEILLQRSNYEITQIVIAVYKMSARVCMCVNLRCVVWMVEWNKLKNAPDIYLPGAFGKNPWCDKGVHHRDCADVGEEFPVCNVVCDPGQNCTSNGEVYAKGDINDEGSSVHSHVFEHWRDSEFDSLTNIKKSAKIFNLAN